MKIRRALLSVSDKTGIVELARALAAEGVELIATGNTEAKLREAGLTVVPVESLSGNPEAFHGRMKTLSFPLLSGVLYRRGIEEDERDVQKLRVPPIDCVVVNFYPFQSGEGKPREERIELVDIGGPTLVRAAAKNAPSTIPVCLPSQYGELIQALQGGKGEIPDALALRFSGTAWEEVHRYDQAIADALGSGISKKLRYGENPHQSAWFKSAGDSPIAWGSPLTTNELSYNNLLDLAAAYELAREIRSLGGKGAVIVKHQNPCGAALHPTSLARALELAWAGDPVSAFGGVIVLTEPLDAESAAFLSTRFIEALAAPSLSGNPHLGAISAKRKGLKAIEILDWKRRTEPLLTRVPGGELFQDPDEGQDPDSLKLMTKTKLPEASPKLGHFGVAIARSLKSNAVAIVREPEEGSLQLIGAGQGQPNRIEAIEWLAIPRAKRVLSEEGKKDLAGTLLVSDAFFPFRDAVDACARAGIPAILQPGGSVRDEESIQACDEHGIAMAFTGRRHFRHG